MTGVKMAVERQSALLHYRATQKVEGFYPASRWCGTFWNGTVARSGKRRGRKSGPDHSSAEVHTGFGAW